MLKQASQNGLAGALQQWITCVWFSKEISVEDMDSSKPDAWGWNFIPWIEDEKVTDEAEDGERREESVTCFRSASKDESVNSSSTHPRVLIGYD